MQNRLATYVDLFAWFAFRARMGRMLTIGVPAPSFSVPDETGRTRTLDEFRGRTLVLWFFPKASTPG